MARKREGFTIRERSPGGVKYVRFVVDGRAVELSTGTSDREAAAREARRIYADAITREKPRPRKQLRTAAVDLEGVIGAWLHSLATTHDPATLKTWELYTTAHFLPFFEAVHNLTSVQADLYMRGRLGKVLADTVRKEHTALRSLGDFAFSNGFIPERMVVPTIPKRVTGTPHPKRRRSPAIELSPKETEAIIAALPKWSTSKRVKPFAIRARFRVAYETGLRPELLESLLAPLHYRTGQETIHITQDLDKGRWRRDVPLSQAARDALDEVLDELTGRARADGTLPKDGTYSGPIFGAHDYRDHLRAAAASVLPPDRAERFNGAHTRSARATHLLEEGANIPGVMFLFGWKQVSTAARYVRPSARAAREALGILGAPKNSEGVLSVKDGT
jgi:integrase